MKFKKLIILMNPNSDGVSQTKITKFDSELSQI